MKIKIESLSKIRNEYIKQGIEEYRKRLHRSIQIDINDKHDKNFLKKITPEKGFIILDRTGKPFDSETFANWLSGKLASGLESLSIIIGPDVGFSQDFHNEKLEKISLSRLTFSGEISVLILMEQFYRAFSIIQKTSYHK